jgi:hypothetical protein
MIIISSFRQRLNKTIINKKLVKTCVQWGNQKWFSPTSSGTRDIFTAKFQLFSLREKYQDEKANFTTKLYQPTTRLHDSFWGGKGGQRGIPQQMYWRILLDAVLDSEML